DLPSFPADLSHVLRARLEIEVYRPGICHDVTLEIAANFLALKSHRLTLPVEVFETVAWFGKAYAEVCLVAAVAERQDKRPPVGQCCQFSFQTRGIRFTHIPSPRGCVTERSEFHRVPGIDALIPEEVRALGVVAHYVGPVELDLELRVADPILGQQP